ncbi:MAG: alpha-L-rhamnosidase N-terminal domain-containing protein, partial [Verrucomicrobiae bacterium]|nr:alpha-L-rhamnosidase N-terminal domain-containing protein [Verrucomicrobiae bacterium]
MLKHLLTICCATTTAAAALSPQHLRCEYRVNPLGIDQRKPRLSWTLASDQPNQKQTAYRILVTSDGKTLWDSGKVTSDETVAVVYDGPPLRSGQRCDWKVKVWDKNGNESDWSQPAFWTMGLLEPSDWKTEWIGFDKARQNIELPDADLTPAKWIWHPADPALNAAAGHRLFVSTFQVPPDTKITKAELLAIGDDNYSVIINTNRVLSANGWTSVKPTDITSYVRPGKNEVRAMAHNASEGPAGFLAKITITLADGRTITHITDGTWKCTESPDPNWETHPLHTQNWPTARVLGNYGIQPWHKTKLQTLLLPPAPHLRGFFRADKPVKNATLYLTALGIADVYLNVKRITDDWFNPGWTDYTKRVYYRTYDVTKLVKQGENQIDAILADGWFSGTLPCAAGPITNTDYLSLIHI